MRCASGVRSTIALIQRLYWSIAAGASPFQPWLKKKILVGDSAFTFSSTVRLKTPPATSSVLSRPSASKAIRWYSVLVPGIL
jgi:hypothetical protein